MNSTIINLISNTQQVLPAITYIINGIKMMAKGFSYFIYLPIKLVGYSPSPVLAQLIYLAVLAYIINKFTKNWFYTLIIIFILTILGSLG